MEAQHRPAGCTAERTKKHEKDTRIKTWTDYDDGEQIQVVAEDGTVYLTSSYRCDLIKTATDDE